MWKYLATFAVFLLLAIYVARQDKRAATQDAHLGNGAVSAKTDEKHLQKDVSDTAGYGPSWYGFFRWPNGTTTWAIILTLLAIAEQTRQTARAAKATEDSVESGKLTAKQQLRAYVSARSTRLFIHDDGGVEIAMELHNSGQTPAYALEGASCCRFGRYPLSNPGDPPPEVRKSRSVIGAGGVFFVLPDIKPSGARSGKELVDLLSSGLVCCINGTYTYRDVFGDTHYIRFQLIVGGPVGLRRDTDKDGREFFVLGNDSEGNVAD
ncbi:MAG: hypothetical protein WCC87_10020 [Candidatus Korobacteraceae bacterium]